MPTPHSIVDDVLEALILLVMILLTTVVTHFSVGMSLLFLVLWILLLPGLWLLLRINPPFVPSTRRTVRTMMELAAIKPGERVCDLGCGDGRLVFAAASAGARAIGYELSLPTYLLAKVRSFFHSNAIIQFGDFWKQDYSNTDVIFCFLLSSTMQKFETEIWPRLKPGCRVVSHAFHMEGLTPFSERNGVCMYIK